MARFQQVSAWKLDVAYLEYMMYTNKRLKCFKMLPILIVNSERCRKKTGHVHTVDDKYNMFDVSVQDKNVLATITYFKTITPSSRLFCNQLTMQMNYL